MPLIEVKNLSKIFQSEKSEAPTIALQGINLSIERGEFVSIVGPSGSGKSTLLQILGLLDRPTSGQYRFDGKLVDEYGDDEQAALRNASLGFIFQSFNLLARTSVLENVKLPLAYSTTVAPALWDARARERIEAVGLSSRMFHEPSQLSGGERQRVAIARALVNEPQIIFADEPTGNLDTKAGKNVIEILQGLHAAGHTVILITHDKDIAKTAERIVALRDGEIVWDGKAKDFKD